MDQLATELLLKVASNLPEPDLSALRLTSKQLCRVAEEFLFKEMILESNLQSLLRLQQLASHSLRKHVKRIIYSGLFLVDEEDFPFDHNAAEVVRRQQIGNFTLDAHRDENSPFQRYIELLRGQKLVESDAMDRYFFQEELEKFPNLQELMFSSGHDGYHCRKFPAVKTSKFEVWKGSTERKSLVRPDVKSGQRHHKRQFEALLAAAHRNPRITQLTAVAIPLKVFQDGLYEDHCLSLANLRHLTLRFQNTYIYQTHTHIPAAMNKATQLETLHLSYGRVDLFSQIPLISLWNVLARDLHLPSLRSLKLEGFLMEAPELAEFLKRHSSTLKVLELRDLSLPPSTNYGQHVPKSAWVWLIRFLEQSLGLKRFYISGQLDENRADGPGWSAYDTNRECFSCREKSPEARLRHQIETFVVHGPLTESFHVKLGQKEFWDDLGGGLVEDCSWRSLRSKGYSNH